MDSLAWLFAGLVGLANALYFRMRLQAAIDARTIVRAEALGFVRGFALWFSVPCAALWVLQLTVAGPAVSNFLTWPWPQKGVALVIVFYVFAALVRWTFLADGADVLSRILVASRRPFFTSPQSLKLLIALTVLVNLAGFVAYEWQAA